jgi:hypothetical protein
MTMLIAAICWCGRTVYHSTMTTLLLLCISDLEQWYATAKAQGQFQSLHPMTVNDRLVQMTGMMVQIAQQLQTGQPLAFLGAFGVDSSMLDPSSHCVQQTPQQLDAQRQRQRAALVTLEAEAAQAAAAAEGRGLPADKAEPEWTPGAAADFQACCCRPEPAPTQRCHGYLPVRCSCFPLGWMQMTRRRRAGCHCSARRRLHLGISGRYLSQWRRRCC